jgi:uncharacterized protein YbaP (TraB family)
LESAVKWGYDEMMSFILSMSTKEELEASSFRNLKMVMKIVELVTNHNSPFIMIGIALHFFGEMGIINLLDKIGYDCDRIVVYEPSRLA